VSGITRSSSGGAIQKALGILRACYVGCTRIGVEYTSIPSAVCEAHPEDEQVMLETCRGP
jgi:hypothetical protein